MPPIQHTFGIVGNIPRHPGAGATQIPQNRPLPNNNVSFAQPSPPPAPGAVELGAPVHTSPIPPAPNPYAQNSYSYVQSPQQPILAYTPHGSNESPDLLAARREYSDVEDQIGNETTALNHRLSNPSENPEVIEALQDSIHRLYLRKGALIQRIQDLQNPYSFAFQQSQAITAMTANPTHQTPLIYDEQTRRANQISLVAKYTATRTQKLRCVYCIAIFLIVLVVVIIALIMKDRYKKRATP